MSLKNEFAKWLVDIDGKTPNTAQQYKSSIKSKLIIKKENL